MFPTEATLQKAPSAYCDCLTVENTEIYNTAKFNGITNYYTLIIRAT